MALGNYISTGQNSCYDSKDVEIPCKNSGQDSEYGNGVDISGGGFRAESEILHDTLTGLQWPLIADLSEFPLTWQESLDWIAA